MTKFERKPERDGTVRSEQEHEAFLAMIRHFAQSVLEHADEEERVMLDRTAGEGDFHKDALKLACENPEKYKAQLVDIIRSLAMVTPRTLFDPVHLGGLYLDPFGEVVVTQGDRVEVDFSDPKGSGARAVPLAVLMLTGPQRGQKKTGADIEIIQPHPRMISE